MIEDTRSLLSYIHMNFWREWRLEPTKIFLKTDNSKKTLLFSFLKWPIFFLYCYGCLSQIFGFIAKTHSRAGLDWCIRFEWFITANVFFFSFSFLSRSGLQFWFWLWRRKMKIVRDFAAIYVHIFQSFLLHIEHRHRTIGAKKIAN